jgi:hypothetical protein
MSAATQRRGLLPGDGPVALREGASPRIIKALYARSFWREG